MKKFWIALAVAVCTLSTAVYGQINIRIEGEYLDFAAAQPFIDDGVTFVPAKTVFESLGYSVLWDAETKTVIIENGENTLIIGVGADYFRINGLQADIDAPARIVDGSVMLPLKAVAESLDMLVIWDAETKTVTLNKDTADVISTDDFLVGMEYYVSSKTIIDSLITETENTANIVDEAVDTGDNKIIAAALTDLADKRRLTLKCLDGLDVTDCCRDYANTVNAAVRLDLDFTQSVIDGGRTNNAVSAEKTAEYVVQRDAYYESINELKGELKGELEKYIKAHAFAGSLSDREQQEIGDFIEGIVKINIDNYKSIVDESLIDREDYTGYAAQLHTYIDKVKRDYADLYVPPKEGQAVAILNYSLKCLERYAAAFESCGKGETDNDYLYESVTASAEAYIQIQSLVVGESPSIFDSEAFIMNCVMQSGEKILKS